VSLMNQNLNVRVVNKRNKSKEVPLASDERTVVVTETPTAEASGYTAIRFEFDDDVVTISVLKDKDVYDDITYSYEQLIEAITGNDGNFLSFDK
jgi:hypothetical protein